MYKKPSKTTNPRRYFGTWGKTYPCEQFNDCDWEYDFSDLDRTNNKNNNKDSRRCREKDNEECENTINIINKVCINQKASADGGEGGDGGDAENGNASGGSASAAAASGLIAIAANVDDPDIKIPFSDDLKQNEQGELETRQSNGTGTSATATAGSATIGTAAGGEGGRGGDGGTAENTATVAIENVVIITCNSDTPNGVSIGTGSRTLDIKVDEKGDTFVNGEKMDEKKLSDGTKVLIFKNSHSENA